MSTNYTENRIKEALRLHNGNVTDAKKQLFQWLYEDHKLVLDITRPHLNGIVAYALQRTLTRMTKSEEEMLEDEAQEAIYSALKDDKLGKELLKGFIGKDVAKFGQEGFARPLHKKAASQKHIDTMQMLAAKSRSKMGDLD